MERLDATRREGLRSALERELRDRHLNEVERLAGLLN